MLGSHKSYISRISFKSIKATLQYSEKEMTKENQIKSKFKKDSDAMTFDEVR